MIDTVFNFSHVSEALGWALVHALWQGLIIGLITWCIIKNINPSKPHLRYNVLHFSLLTLFGWFAYTFVNQLQGSKGPELVIFSGFGEGEGSMLITVGETESSYGMFSFLGNTLEPFIVPLFLLWMVGVVIFTIRLAIGLLEVKRLRTQQLVPVGPDLQRQIFLLCSKLAINKNIRVAYSRLVQVPAVLGHVKPMVLLPFGFFSGLSPQQVEAIIVHELTHIKRNDYLFNLVKSIAEIIFFYHPVYWWISNHIQLERENCCDDASISVCSPVDYARALAILEEKKISAYGLSIAATGKESHLFCRIKRLLTPQKKKNNMSSKIIFAVVVLIGFGLMSFNPVTGNEQEINTMETSLNLEDAFVMGDTDSIPPETPIAPTPPEPPVPPSPVVAPSAPAPPKAPEAPEPTIAPTPPVVPTPPEPPVAPEPPQPSLELKKEAKTKLRVNEDATPVLAGFFTPISKLELDQIPFFSIANIQTDTIPPEKLEDLEKELEEKMRNLEEQISETVEKRMKDFELNQERIEEIAEEWASELELKFGDLGEEIEGLFSDEQIEKLESLGEEISKSLEGLEDIISEQTESILEELEDELELFEEKFEQHFEQMRGELESEMLKDGLIQNKGDKIEITSTKSGELKINGTKLTEQQEKKYKDILYKYIDFGGKTTISL
ncbi:MAG: M56 family metallopeptidase [Bacteroidota bacterium]